MLARFGEREILEKEMKQLCGYMLGHDPGTFWETLGGVDSRNHGFGSHYGVVVMEDFLGMGIPNCRDKTVRFAPGRGSLQWAKGRICLEDGQFVASWHRGTEGLAISMRAPEGYRILLELPGEYIDCGKILVNGEELDFCSRLETPNILDAAVGALRIGEDGPG